ncbi:hypothetical protein H1R20_g14699, partial [Candolleomyces eurysporus]
MSESHPFPVGVDEDDSGLDPQGSEFFARAHHFSVNELKFTQARRLQKTKFVIYNSSGHLIELFKLLNPITDASHKRNRKVAPPDSHCLPGTREEVLQEVRSWASAVLVYSTISSDTHTKHICWMYGYVGCGKSAIAQNISEEFASNGKLGASFFFFRGAGDRSNASRLAATISHQISQNIPGAKAFIEQAIVNDPALIDPTCSLEAQLEDLVWKPCLKALCQPECPTATGAPVAEDRPYLIVVDGLDECGDKEGVQIFIDRAVEFFARNPLIPLRLFITSRIEEHIQTHLEDASPNIHLIDLTSMSRRGDLTSFMEVAFTNARKHNRALRALGAEWPKKDDVDQLVDYCDGSFIFGMTLFKFILGGSGDDDPRTPMERLPLALKINPGLDGVYTQVLSRSQHFRHFHLIISTVALAQEPLSIAGLAALLQISTYDIIRVLVNLQAVLQVPGRDDIPVTLFHTSLRDFLMDQSRSEAFYTSPSHHTFLMYRCLSALLGPKPSKSVECCRYAFMYWARHLTLSKDSDPAFDKDAICGLPYFPTLKDDFRSQWLDTRPLSFVLRDQDWPIMVQNIRTAATALADNPLKSHRPTHQGWQTVKTEGYGRSCPPIVKVESSVLCSIKDIVNVSIHRTHCD